MRTVNVGKDGGDVDEGGVVVLDEPLHLASSPALHHHHWTAQANGVGPPQLSMDGWDWGFVVVGCLDGLGVWMGWVFGWVGCLDGLGVWMGWVFGWVGCFDGLGVLMGWAFGRVGCLDGLGVWMGWVFGWVGCLDGCLMGG